MNIPQYKIPDRTVVIILGPTGVGKTGLSILLARALKTEIISADSMLVYRHMDIGTAKPSSQELTEVPHHLINILEPYEKFSAGLFKEKASAIIKSLHDRNKIPLIVGGTGLYIRSLTAGLFEGPGADELLREQLKEKEKQHGKGYLYEKLKAVDPEAASKIEEGDLRRIVRALEVSLKTQEGISAIQQGSTQPLDCHFIKIGLSRDRKELYSLIEGRVDKMMNDGLLNEARRLLTMNPGKTAMQALGYKEMAMHLDGDVDLNEAVRLTKKRTKNYAKRQYTWFRKEPDIHWVDITGIMKAREIFEKTINHIEIIKKLIYSNVC
ncbi:MAG: tRNA (adenosine(37)-N6)-dimethylallyltransferase MiaA [Nitrospiraceae bacterium]|nr:MAG: tRNA (adenosine(37)-N6)-dimethylallyltransferase MiaA [Nitrospiraceae bacterium]